MGQKFITFLKTHETKIVTAIGFILIAAISFEFGLIQGKKVQNTPLIIESQSTDLTDIEEEQCIMCYSNKRNLFFRPCNHNISCSECYLKFDKKLECPMCKGIIQSLD